MEEAERSLRFSIPGHKNEIAKNLHMENGAAEIARGGRQTIPFSMSLPQDEPK